jgi:hypothetical protein
MDFLINYKDFMLEKINDLSESNLTNVITREYFFYLYLQKMKYYILTSSFVEKEKQHLIINTYKYLGCFVALIYEHHGELNFANLENFEKSILFFLSEESCLHQDEKHLTYITLQNYMKTKYEKILKRIQHINAKYTGKPLVLPKNIKITKKTEEEKKIILLLYMQYDNLEYIGRGNQWTMRYKSEMKLLNELGFIEMFASPFNRTLNRYCSLFENDKNFGALGNYETIFNLLLEEPKNNKVIKLCISPPSGYMIQKKIVDKVLQLLQTKSAIITMGLSVSFTVKGNLFVELKKSGYLRDFRFNDYCYDMRGNNFIKMTHRPWLAVILANVKVDHKKLLYFEKESPLENPEIMELEKIKFSNMFF